MTGAGRWTLHRRGMATAVAAWGLLARAAPGARVHRLPGVAAAVFPAGSERAVYNNAVLDAGMEAEARRAAVEAMEEAYASASVGRFAAWVHEDDAGMREELGRRGYVVAEATRSMGMALDGDGARDDDGRVAPARLREHLRIIGMPDDFLAGIEPAGLRIVVGRSGGEAVATAMAVEAGGDCGIYNVATRPDARRRGLGTALTAALVRAAAGRGCTTATLQATAMAEGLYAAIGFRDLGVILEHVRA